MKLPLIAAMALVIASGPALANPIERACNQSERNAANPRLCSCIGRAAELTLSPSEQRQAARFFRDPQRAQDVRMSDRRSDEALWSNYRNFGDTAEAMCS